APTPGPGGALDASPAADAKTADGHSVDAPIVDAPIDVGADAACSGQPYNFAPPSRTVAPVAVFSTTGAVSNPNDVLSGRPTTLAGAGTQIVLDFGKEVGGILALEFANAS